MKSTKFHCRWKRQRDCFACMKIQERERERPRLSESLRKSVMIGYLTLDLQCSRPVCEYPDSNLVETSSERDLVQHHAFTHKMVLSLALMDGDAQAISTACPANRDLLFIVTKCQPIRAMRLVRGLFAPHEIQPRRLRHRLH
jgi:hypothetical protein